MTRIGQEIKNDPESGQFFFELNGQTGHLKYTIKDHRIDLRSTFVPAELRGQKLGDLLVEHAIKFAKDKELKIIATCPFVGKYFSKHPEYSEMLSS
jgi:predicted GNAT family acetyltransferase